MDAREGIESGIWGIRWVVNNDKRNVREIVRKNAIVNDKWWNK